MKGVRLHDLRHLHATQLLAAGVPVRTVSGRLGHANAATTLNVYAHFLEASDRDAANVIEGATASGRPSPTPASTAGSPGGEGPGSCSPLPRQAETAGLEVRVVDPGGPIAATGVVPLEFEVTVVNVSDEPLWFGSGDPAAGVILDLTGDVVSDGGEMNITGVGLDEELEPGDSLMIDLVASVQSCDAALGPALPAGRYQLIAVLEAGRPDRKYLSEPLEFTLTG